MLDIKHEKQLRLLNSISPIFQVVSRKAFHMALKLGGRRCIVYKMDDSYVLIFV